MGLFEISSLIISDWRKCHVSLISSPVFYQFLQIQAPCLSEREIFRTLDLARSTPSIIVWSVGGGGDGGRPVIIGGMQGCSRRRRPRLQSRSPARCPDDTSRRKGVTLTRGQTDGRTDGQTDPLHIPMSVCLRPPLTLSLSLSLSVMAAVT